MCPKAREHVIPFTMHSNSNDVTLSICFKLLIWYLHICKVISPGNLSLPRLLSRTWSTPMARTPPSSCWRSRCWWTSAASRGRSGTTRTAARTPTGRFNRIYIGKSIFPCCIQNSMQYDDISGNIWQFAIPKWDYWKLNTENLAENHRFCQSPNIDI